MARLDRPEWHQGNARPNRAREEVRRDTGMPSHPHPHAHRPHHHHDDGHHHLGPGHNDPILHELHSHLHGEGAREDLKALAAQFIDGFRAAEDKQSFLRLAGVPDQLPGEDGLARRLVDITISDGFQVATASPGFGSRELVYLPFPGSMIEGRTKLTFVYVSLTGRTDVDLVEFLAARFSTA